MAGTTPSPLPVTGVTATASHRATPGNPMIAQ